MAFGGNKILHMFKRSAFTRTVQNIFVKTNIMECERNRPEEYLNSSTEVEQDSGYEEMDEVFRQLIESGIPPAKVATDVFKAIVDEKFFIFTHPEMKPLIRARMDDIFQGRNPVLPPPPMEGL